MDAPIIFIHYGGSKYLNYTLNCAKKYNPEKKVFLLGDHNNQRIASNAGVEHIMFQHYDHGKEIETFNKNFKFIAGVEHGSVFWTRFVFKRWFLIYQFIKTENINRFWTFDSDTLIVTKLLNQEKKFEHFDCTEQCNGCCMNGYINNQQVVKGYVDKINELFQRSDYLDEKEEEMKRNPKYAFTEMGAYLTYKKECNINSFYLGSVFNSEVYDDTLTDDHGMEMFKSKINSRQLKKIYIKPDNSLYFKERATGNFIKANSLNMSWMPMFVYENILQQKKPNLKNQFVPLSYSDEPFIYTIKSVVYKLLKALKIR